MWDDGLEATRAAVAAGRCPLCRERPCRCDELEGPQHEDLPEVTMPRGSGRAKTTTQAEAADAGQGVTGEELSATEIFKRTMRAHGQLRNLVEESVTLQREAKSTRLERLAGQVMAGMVSSVSLQALESLNPHDVTRVAVRLAAAAETELALVERERDELGKGGGL